MQDIPRPALLLGLAGLLPFLGSALAAHELLPFVAVQPFVALFMMQTYAAAILAFMGGCLWGFAAQEGRSDWKFYAISVIPSLWAWFVIYQDGTMGLISLIFAFVVLFTFDLMFRGWGLGPKWWITLRTGLTAVVLVCLVAGLLA